MGGRRQKGHLGTRADWWGVVLFIFKCDLRCLPWTFIQPIDTGRMRMWRILGKVLQAEPGRDLHCCAHVSQPDVSLALWPLPVWLLLTLLPKGGIHVLFDHFSQLKVQYLWVMLSPIHRPERGSSWPRDLKPKETLSPPSLSTPCRKWE